ncbi:MAG TPA: HAMP domain-containing sensor histidine kinase [Candidatus Omnitrophota bacterium]|nr:HAMP domain-containing sensor histidine kinase [Candidatus Omnitrophota bacterium]HPS36984.1 HAMP domain-containing sensor histidine kinase [Candidatus Omnitrophota bacterium]
MPQDRNELKLLFHELEDPYKQLRLAFFLISVIPILALLYILCDKVLSAGKSLSDLAPILFFACLIIVLGYIAGYRVIRNILNKILSYAAKAKRADELKSAFALSLAHDLKSPLAVIKASLSNLKAGFLGALTPQQVETVDICNGVTDRMDTILMGLINNYKIEAHMAEVTMSDFDLRELIKEQGREFEVIAGAKHITLSVLLPKRSLPFRGDKTMILRAINNLVSNAIKYTPPGGSVMVNAHAAEDLAKIEVLNTGAPIPDDRLERIFDKFERLDRSVEGEGLGLAIAKDIVELHKGKIWATSGIGKPNCFTILLALAKE